jgi:hypothetical protein
MKSKMDKKSLIIGLTLSICIGIIAFYVIPQIGNPLLTPVPVNGSTEIKTIDVRINENFLQAPSLFKGYTYEHYYFYSGYYWNGSRDNTKVAIFTISTPGLSSPGPIMLYIHQGESFITNGKTYTLKSINDGSVTLEVSS